MLADSESDFAKFAAVQGRLGGTEFLSAFCVLGSGSLKLQFESLKFLGFSLPNGEFRFVQLCREARIAFGAAGCVTFTLQAAILIFQFVEPVLQPFNFFDFPASKVCQSLGQGPDFFNCSGMLLRATGKSDCSVYRWQTASVQQRGFVPLPQLPQLIRTALQPQLHSCHGINLRFRVIEFVPLATPLSTTHAGKEILNDPVQIEAARHLPSDLGGDVLRPGQGRIDQIPETEKETAVVVGRRNAWLHPVLTCATPSPTWTVTFRQPCIPVQFEVPGNEGSLRRTAVIPKQTFDRAANTRLSDRVRSENNVDTCARRFDLEPLVDTRQSVDGEPLQPHDGSPISFWENIAVSALIPDRMRTLRNASSDTGLVAFLCSSTGDQRSSRATSSNAARASSINSLDRSSSCLRIINRRAIKAAGSSPLAISARSRPSVIESTTLAKKTAVPSTTRPRSFHSPTAMRFLMSSSQGLVPVSRIHSPNACGAGPSCSIRRTMLTALSNSRSATSSTCSSPSIEMGTSSQRSGPSGICFNSSPPPSRNFRSHGP